VALTDLNPTGQVRVDREDWSAVASEAFITEGEAVRVKGITGVRLDVASVEEDD
jgi:membrane-bound ClpP family serine protease